MIGRACYRVSEDDALDYVFGVCPVLDQTAEDILQRNPRFLTWAKNFPTFFSFGPTIVPLAELLAAHDLSELTVSTVANGLVTSTNVVASMAFSPALLISRLSHVMPLWPGDLVSTGTPGAARVVAGDVVECQISGLPSLRNAIVSPA